MSQEKDGGCRTECPACGNAFNDPLACCASCFSSKPFAPRPWSSERREKAGRTAFEAFMTVRAEKQGWPPEAWEDFSDAEREAWRAAGQAAAQEDEENP